MNKVYSAIAGVEGVGAEKHRATLLEWSMRPTYAKAVAFEGNSDEAWPPHRIESVARWIAVKLFLAHLYERWCEVEGIERKGPYIMQYGTPDQRHHYIPAPLPEIGRAHI